MRHHALLLILFQPSLHIKSPQGICHIHIWIHGFENQYVQICGSKAVLILPPPPVTSTTKCFTHCGISIQISPSCVRRGWGRVSGTLLCWLGFGMPSLWVACRCPNGPSTPCVFHWTSPYSSRRHFPPTVGYSPTCWRPG